MAKELFISSTPHETKVAVVEDEQLTEIYFERENEYTLAGSIYKGRVTRVLPGMQSAFVDIGLERDAFLYVTDFLEEQEDQEEFEQVVSRAHSDAHQPPRLQQQSTPALEEGDSDAESEEQSGQDANASPESFDRSPRRWRGRRGRRRRGGFPEQNSPSNLATKADGDGTEAQETEAEPTLLPGESLSKYRHSEAAEEQQPHESVASPPAEQASVAQAAPVQISPEPQAFRLQPPEASAPMSVLPGESISKYRNRGTQSDPSTEPAPPSSPQGSDRSYGRGSRWERPSRRPER
jgi:ribonuclease G